MERSTAKIEKEKANSAANLRKATSLRKHEKTKKLYFWILLLNWIWNLKNRSLVLHTFCCGLSYQYISYFDRSYSDSFRVNLQHPPIKPKFRKLIYFENGKWKGEFLLVISFQGNVFGLIRQRRGLLQHLCSEFRTLRARNNGKRISKGEFSNFKFEKFRIGLGNYGSIIYEKLPEVRLIQCLVGMRYKMRQDWLQTGRGKIVLRRHFHPKYPVLESDPTGYNSKGSRKHTISGRGADLISCLPIFALAMCIIAALLCKFKNSKTVWSNLRSILKTNDLRCKRTLSAGKCSQRAMNGISVTPLVSFFATSHAHLLSSPFSTQFYRAPSDVYIFLRTAGALRIRVERSDDDVGWC